MLARYIVLILFTLSFSFASIGATCKISFAIKEYWDCATLVTKFDVDSKEECLDLVNEAKATRFFGKLDKKDIHLSTTMTFKQKSPKIKVKEKFVYADRNLYCY